MKIRQRHVRRSKLIANDRRGSVELNGTTAEVVTLKRVSSDDGDIDSQSLSEVAMLYASAERGSTSNLQSPSHAEYEQSVHSNSEGNAV